MFALKEFIEHRDKSRGIWYLGSHHAGRNKADAKPGLRLTEQQRLELKEEF
jgi:hypothetical protein